MTWAIAGVLAFAVGFLGHRLRGRWWLLELAWWMLLERLTEPLYLAREPRDAEREVTERY